MGNHFSGESKSSKTIVRTDSGRDLLIPSKVKTEAVDNCSTPGHCVKNVTTLKVFPGSNNKKKYMYDDSGDYGDIGDKKIISQPEGMRASGVDTESPSFIQGLQESEKETFREKYATASFDIKKKGSEASPREVLIPTKRSFKEFADGSSRTKYSVDGVTAARVKHDAQGERTSTELYNGVSVEPTGRGR